MSAVRKLLMAILVFLIVVVAGLYLGQRSLFYPAPQERLATPPAGYQFVETKTSDGLRLRAAYRPAADGKATLLFFHGNGDNIDGAGAATQMLTDAGYGAMLVEYRGYGGNAGSPSEQGFYSDGEAAVKWLGAKGVGLSEVIIIGNSIGSGAATEMALRHRPKALVLVSGFASLPYVVSGMVAAGGLAAALSTADGLLLTISNALSHDLYYKMLDRNASSTRRVTISKVLLLAAALAAAALATQKPAGILFLVTAAFSIAASAFFPALVLGIFWSRANRWGAVFGMASGLAVTLYYLIRNEAWLRSLFGVSAAPDLWFAVLPVSAGVFGVPTGFVVCVLASLLTPAPTELQRRFVRRLRYPREV